VVADHLSGVLLNRCTDSALIQFPSPLSLPVSSGGWAVAGVVSLQRRTIVVEAKAERAHTDGKIVISGGVIRWV
jgi:hypothetical protein